MKVQTLLLSFALVACLASQVCGKTVFRRTDKISENFKQLDLPAEEVDPNVAPPAPQQLVETIDPEDDVSGSSGGATAPADEVVDEIEEAAPEVVGTAAAAVDEVIDEAANEVEGAAVEAATPVAAPAAAAAAAVTPASVAAEATTTPVKNEDDPTGLSKYCKCTDSHCDCCRNFGLPILPVRGPGCAKITYLGNEKMSVSIKYGDITLATRTISGKNARPICVGLPGGYSKFCGRIYGLSKAKENFKACLGFELRAEDEVEAALRVSCFKFGPDGLRVAEAEPLPSEVNKDEDDDDDDIFGFGAGDDDEDDDDYGDDEDDEEEADEDEDDDYGDDEDTEAPEDADYGGFSLGGLLSELADDDEETTVSNKPAATPAVAVAADATRAVQKDAMQSKDDKGTEAAADNSAADAAAAAPASVEEAAAATPAPEEAAATTQPSKKGKRAKKAKKNKKKKASSDTDYAFEIINGILDFFN